jgi:uncharacterized membrane protein YccF (DUF307 family)
MARTLGTFRWIIYGAWLVLALLALMMAFTQGVSLLGLPVERITFTPATITGLPWTLPLFFTKLDSVTTLAVIFVAHLLNVSIGLMLARSGD